jgi:hypothetical protein
MAVVRASNDRKYEKPTLQHHTKQNAALEKAHCSYLN